jgi:hypothetical protein
MQQHRQLSNLRRRWPWWVLGILALVSLLALLPVQDYRYYVAATRAWLAGSARLYDDPSLQFFYTPWALLIMVSLSWLPDQVAQAVLNTCSLLGIWGATQELVRPASLLGLLPALVNPYTASVLLLGQWDGLVLAGGGLGWYAAVQRRPWLLGAALVLAATKPTNVWLPLLLLVWLARHWPWSQVARVCVLPLLALLGSFLVAGWDWPLRYVAYVRSTPPLGFNVALWQTEYALAQAVIAGGALVWLLWLLRGGIAAPHLALALAINLLLSPFVVPYHMVTVGPALAEVSRRCWWAGVLLWMLALLTFVAFVQRWQPSLALLYPLLVFVALALLMQQARNTEALHSEQV